MRERSSTSPMTARSVSVELSAAVTNRAWRSLSASRSSSCSIPITPLIGVRISWLMLARNWDLARFAASAASFAARSSSWARRLLPASIARARRSASEPTKFSSSRVNFRRLPTCSRQMDPTTLPPTRTPAASLDTAPTASR